MHVHAPSPTDANTSAPPDAASSSFARSARGGRSWRSLVASSVRDQHAQLGRGTLARRSRGAGRRWQRPRAEAFAVSRTMGRAKFLWAISVTLGEKIFVRRSSLRERGCEGLAASRKAPADARAARKTKFFDPATHLGKKLSSDALVTLTATLQTRAKDFPCCRAHRAPDENSRPNDTLERKSFARRSRATALRSRARVVAVARPARQMKIFGLALATHVGTSLQDELGQRFFSRITLAENPRPTIAKALIETARGCGLRGRSAPIRSALSRRTLAAPASRSFL
mmetsp:Transcript_25145/g.63300  ORF Transcript_25145/g.63300 Transcript_25145/m.63300 type:complete len:284 (+) Transcript_25145:302-1153(+)